LDVLTHTLLPFIGILLGLLVVHEAGHYITAKMLGVKVLEAGVGLPPRIWGFTWRDTIYSINALPFGAFVRLLGEEDPTDPQSLAAAPKWKRTVILGAGVVMNLALAITLFAVALMIPHRVGIGGASIGSVAPNSPAQAADLREGDEIVAVDGRHVENTLDASTFLKLHQGQDIDLTLKRKETGASSSETINKTVYSRWNPGSYTDECGVEHAQGPIGITIGPTHIDNISTTAADRPKEEAQDKSDFAAYKKQIAPGAPASCYGGSAFHFAALNAQQCSGLDADQQAEAQALKAELFAETNFPCYTYSAPQLQEERSETRTEPFWEAIPHGARQSYESLILLRNTLWARVRGFSGSSPLTGPVGIAQVTGEVVDKAGWQSLIELAASISMSLALLNALPIPMVDGGRLTFVLIEFLRRGKRVAPEKEALVHFAGLVAMLILFVVITFFDISRIIH